MGSIWYIIFKTEGYIHITEIYERILRNWNNRYHNRLWIVFRWKANKVDDLLRDITHKKNSCVNPFAASKHRDTNLENILKIGKMILEDENNILIL